MKPLEAEKLGKLCKRCYRHAATDVICPACKNELIALFDNKLTWRTAYEVERISKRAMRYAREGEPEEGL
jgi:hypothetical protein